MSARTHCVVFVRRSGDSSGEIHGNVPLAILGHLFPKVRWAQPGAIATTTHAIAPVHLGRGNRVRITDVEPQNTKDLRFAVVLDGY
jgi:hypothetical protein